ncbi:hypothetical protein MN608_08787 [Microdochium nivale]|nr:hypothetical protein MN608_08787 [Microdochium nivale]
MQPPTPFVVAGNLAPSASFYSAVTHPLGLRFISASPSSLKLGDTTGPSPAPVFEVKQSANQGAELSRPTRIIFSAASPEVVKSFHAAALRANPDLLNTPSVDQPIIGISYLAPDCSSAKVSDLDGNIMEVVYVNPRDYPPGHSGGTVRQTQSTNSEASRILDWNLDVATSHPARSVAGSVTMDGDSSTLVSRRPGGSIMSDSSTLVSRRPGRPMEGGGGGPVLTRRTTTTSTIHYAQPQAPSKQTGGLATNSLIGSVLGAAAVGAAVGGALAYCLSRNEQTRAPQQEFDAAPPPLSRRSTYHHPEHAQRIIEVERTETISYPENYGINQKKYPPISGSQYSPAVPRSRAMEDIDDMDRQSQFSTASRSRRRSEVSTSRQPLLIADHEFRSVASSKHSAVGAPKLLLDHAYRSESGSDFVTNQAYHDVTASRRNGAPSVVNDPLKPVKHDGLRAPNRAPSHVGTTFSATQSRRGDEDRRSHAIPRAPPLPVGIEAHMSGRSNRSSAGTARPTNGHGHSSGSISNATPKRTMHTGEHGATMDLNVGNILVNEFHRSRKPSSTAGKAERLHHKNRDRSRDDARSRVSAAAPSKVKGSRSRAPSQGPMLTPSALADEARSVWQDDDNRSVAPDDSISCIGSRRRRH